MSDATSNPPQRARSPEERTTELQSKLYQAAKQDRERRFHALYDKLSVPYLLRRAWELVRRNQGAAGLDHQTIEAVEAYGVDRFLAEIQESLKAKTYRPTPVRRVEIPKGDGKTRPLGIPTVRDRVVQAAAKLVLEPIFEADFEGTPSFGFRPETGAREAMDAVREHSRRGFRWVVDGDIERFFDTLDHQQLMAALRRRISDGEMLRLIYRWLKAGYVADTTHHDSDQGSPQGSVISPLLSNVYLHRFDEALTREKSFIGRLTRYADDFVIQCGTREQAEQALAWASRFLAALGVRLHPEKTRIVEDREGFDFLGFHHQRVISGWGARKGRESWGVQRWPGRKAQGKFRERVRELLAVGRLQTDWEGCLEGLERYLRGWGQYFRCGQSRLVFAKLDRYVLERLARSRSRARRYQRGHRRRSWQQCLEVLRQWGRTPQLLTLTRGEPGRYRGRANARWRAV